MVPVEQEQHLELTGGENRRDAVRYARAAAAAAHLVEKPARDGPRKGRVAVDDSFEELGDPVRRLGLEHVAGRAAANRGEQVLLGARGREHDDLAAGRGLAKPRQRREPV